MPAMFKANERCYNRTFGLYGLETLNHRSELKVLWDTFRSRIAELWFPYDRRIADDRRRSQMIAEDRTWFYLLRSSAIVCDHDRRIAGDRRSVFPYDRRRSQNFLRSAICDPRSSAIIWKPALSIFAKNGKSHLVLVFALVLESKGPYYDNMIILMTIAKMIMR